MKPFTTLVKNWMFGFPEGVPTTSSRSKGCTCFMNTSKSEENFKMAHM